MQSKQGKRSKALKQNRKTASARAAPRREAKRERKAPAIAPREKRTYLSAPINSSTIRRNFFGFSFGRAAPHDEFPEGGLRIAGTLPGTSVSGSIVNDVSSVGVFGTTGQTGIAVDPTGTTGPGLSALFSNTGPLATFAQFFRRYRFRSLVATYNGSIPTSSADNKLVQISYERDAWNVASTIYTLTNAVTAQTARFNSWVPEVVLPFISHQKESRDDELFWTGQAGDNIGSTVAAEFRQRLQGALIGVTTAVAPTADVVFGNVIYRFEIDLYGFTNVINAGVPTLRKKPELSLTEASMDKGDRKELHDFVELTPKSRRVDSTPPPSVRVSSRKS
jgi:hypothetical protein